jgi:SAM domain (Sterile alpha motif)
MIKDVFCSRYLVGLDNTMYQYTHSFTNNGVSGKQLLNIRPYELEQLGIKLIGHQEIILEAVDYLKNFVGTAKFAGFCS